MQQFKKLCHAVKKIFLTASNTLGVLGIVLMMVMAIYKFSKIPCFKIPKSKTPKIVNSKKFVNSKNWKLQKLQVQKIINSKNSKNQKFQKTIDSKIKDYKNCKFQKQL